MENIIIRVVNKTTHILGDFEPGTLLVSSDSGAKLLVVGRKREIDARYIELLKIAEELAEGAPETFSISTALVVSAAVPRPGETVKPYHWPSGSGIYSPEGKFDLFEHADTPHLWIMGTTGSGKSTLAKFLVERAAREGRRVVVLDVHDEYCQTVQGLGGTCIPAILPFCNLSDSELLALTGLLRVGQAIRMMRYLSFFRRAFCRLAKQVQIQDVRAALQKCADAMIMLDVIRTDIQSLTGNDSLMTEFVKVLKEEIGNVAFNALKEVVRKDEDRMAAAMMYLLQALEQTEVMLDYELPKVVAIRLLDFRSLFTVSDYILAVVSYTFRYLMEMREDAFVVIEETPKFLTDDAARRNISLFLSEARKFGAMAALVSQVPDELIQNTRLVVGKIGNPSYAKKVAELSPQMPTAVAKLLPQLSRGQFVYIDGQRTLPIRVVV
jgi:energy-coupling factor transporter ATP-binding protein EcfA2